MAESGIASKVVAPYPRFDGTQPCMQVDPEVFFPDDSNGYGYRAARRICAGCAVIKQCLAFALTHRVDGIWGGTSPRQRQLHQKEHGIRPVPVSLTPHEPTLGVVDEDGRLTTPTPGAHHD